jgi:hypothetical protein
MTNPSLQIQPHFLIVALVHLEEKIMRKDDYEGEALQHACIKGLIVSKISRRILGAARRSHAGSVT